MSAAKVDQPTKQLQARQWGDETSLDIPLVSCIMPTYNRRQFVPRAVATFQSQDYPNLELVVVDDGTDPVGDCLPVDPRIRYVRLEGRRRSIGAKRNLACAEAQGEFIAHWDDDDWYPSWRISDQVRTLREQAMSLCGSSQIYYLDEAGRKAWRYACTGLRKPWVVGSTLVYRRDRWAKQPFLDIQVGEDTKFVWGTDRSQIVDLSDPSLCIAFLHPANTTTKKTRGPYWQRIELNEVQNLRSAKPIVPCQMESASDVFSSDAKTSRIVSTPPLTSSNGQTSAVRPTIVVPRALKQDQDVASSDHPSGVTISLPYYKCRPHLRRAVDSILAQTHKDLTLVVINDGDRSAPWDLLADIKDPRLVRFDLPVNRGRYFADAVVLNAMTTPYFALQDADDWSEPRRLAVLIRALCTERAECASSAMTSYRLVNGKIVKGRVEQLSRGHQPPITNTCIHRLSHISLFHGDALRRIGGPYAGYVIGYDTLLMNLVLMTTNVAMVRDSLYNRLIRVDSLAHSRGTGMRSPARMAVWRELQELYDEAYGWYRDYVEGHLTWGGLVSAIRTLIESRLTTSDAATLREESERLRSVLRGSHDECEATALTSQARDVIRERAQPAARHDQTQLERLVHGSGLRWHGWTVDKDVARHLVQRLSTKPPRRVLEAGSGNTTVVLAALAAQYGFTVVSLEHDPTYLEQTRQLLRRTGLHENVELRLAPLRRNSYRGRQSYPWYETSLDGTFDFVFIDGPPQRHGRQATLFAISPYLSADAELWLHNARRPHETQCVKLWHEEFDFLSHMAVARGQGVLAIEQIQDKDTKLVAKPAASPLAKSRLSPSADDAIAALAEVEKRSDKEVGARHILWIARRLFQQGHGALAKNTAERALRIAPQDQEIRREYHKLTSELVVLRGEWEGPVFAGEQLHSVPGRILHVVGSSAPYRQAGYTVRTTSLLEAQRGVGLAPEVVTKLGFPWIDGVNEATMTEEIGGVLHHRLVPFDAAPDMRLKGESVIRALPVCSADRLAENARRLMDLTKSRCPSVIHAASDFHNALLALAVGRSLGLPTVYEVRGFWEETWLSLSGTHAVEADIYQWRKQREIDCARQADAVVTLAEVMKRELVNQGVPAEKIVVVPNAVDADVFMPVERNADLAMRLGIDPGETVLGYVSSIVPYEGIEFLIEATARLIALGQRVKTLLVGDGSDRKRLQQRADELGIMDKVIFTGRVPHESIRQYYALIDIFVVPRTTDRVSQLVTPLKPYEAMAMERAILVSGVPALEEMVVAGETGLVFRAEDAEHLAVVAQKLINEPERRQALGRAARNWVCTHRTWRENGCSYRELYESLSVQLLD